MAGKEPKSEKPQLGILPDKTSHSDNGNVLPSMPDLPSVPDLGHSKVDILNVAQGDEPNSPPPIPGGGKLPTDQNE